MEIDEKTAGEMEEEDLFKAAESGHSAVFKALLEEQLSKASRLRNEDCRSLLHVAVSSSQTEVVEVLSAASPSVVNSCDEEGWAPLHSAASSGNIKIVEILLHSGADVNIRNDGGRTALHYAASKGLLKIAETLVVHGAKLNVKDKACNFFQQSSYFIQCFWNLDLILCSKFDQVKLLMHDNRVQFGCTPLHRAASTGNMELCEFLIEEGAEVDAVDKAGQTPLMTAVVCNNKYVALLLIRHGADVDSKDKEGYTVLARASSDLRPCLVDAAQAMLEG